MRAGVDTGSLGGGLTHVVMTTSSRKTLRRRPETGTRSYSREIYLTITFVLKELYISGFRIQYQSNKFKWKPSVSI